MMRNWKLWLHALVDLIAMVVTLCMLIVGMTLLFGSERQANDLGLFVMSIRRSLGL
jgi:uncharacterized membrane protein